MTAYAILSAPLMLPGKADAATYKLYPTDDAIVDESVPDRTGGGLNYLQIGGAGDSAQAYLKFSLDSIDSKERIIRVSFSIYEWWVGSGSGRIDIFHIADDAWSEGTINWENQPDDFSNNSLLGSRNLEYPFKWLNWELMENGNWDPLSEQNDGFLSLLITTTRWHKDLFLFSKEMGKTLSPVIRVVTKTKDQDPTEPPIVPAPSSLVLLLAGCLLGLAKIKKKAHPCPLQLCRGKGAPCKERPVCRSLFF